MKTKEKINTKFNKHDMVFIESTNSIGFIIDMGFDNLGWYFRTDCDGIREEHEMFKIVCEKSLQTIIEKHNPNIAPSINKKVDWYFLP